MGRKREASWMNYYHFVWRCNNRNNTFYEPLIKEALVETIYNSLKNYRIKISAATIMDNHLHIVMYSKNLDLIQAFSQSVGAGLRHKLDKLEGSSGHIFDKRYSLQPINDHLQLVATLAYVLNNPIKAGMVKNPADYDFSNYRDLKWDKNKPVKTSKVACIIDKKQRRKMISDRELIQITKELKKTSIDDFLEMEPKKRISMFALQKKFKEFTANLNASLGACSRDIQVEVVKYLLSLHANRFQIKRVTGIGYYTVSQIVDECRPPGVCKVVMN